MTYNANGGGGGGGVGRVVALVNSAGTYDDTGSLNSPAVVTGTY